MHDLRTLKSGGYRDAGLIQLKLLCPLPTFPEEILELGDTLEQLDLSGTGLSSLPAALGSALPNLKVALFSDCNFRVFPKELASCLSLETAVFRNNAMEEIPDDAFPPHLRCLILTNNCLTSIPSSIGRCQYLQKCVLTGNQLRGVPSEMASCKKLAVLRLSSNNLSALPSWLFALPELAFLSFASNLCAFPTANGIHTSARLASIAWSDLEVQQTLDAGTSSSLWHQSPHYAEDVAVKLFRGSLPSDDGCAADEMAAWLTAGAHESLITVLGCIHGHPDEDTASSEEAGEYQGGIVLQLTPDDYTPLSSPPSTDNLSPPLASPPPPPTASTSTSLPTGTTPHLNELDEPIDVDIKTTLQMLTGLAGALSHLHARGIAHGSLFPHNILTSTADAHALLTGFEAATRYGTATAAATATGGDYVSVGLGARMERMEVLAFGRLMGGFFLRHVKRGEEDGAGEVERGLWELCGRCVRPEVAERPGFAEVVECLEGMTGWRGMMRIPDVNARAG